MQLRPPCKYLLSDFFPDDAQFKNVMVVTGKQFAHLQSAATAFAAEEERARLKCQGEAVNENSVVTEGVNNQGSQINLEKASKKLGGERH